MIISFSKKKQLHTIGVVSLLLYVFVSYCIDRSDFSYFILAYSLLFGAYWYFNKFGDIYLKPLLVYAFLFRVVHVFAVPHLSDDFYRFLWDGLCTLNDINPFDYTPIEASDLGLLKSGVLLDNMNSPNYYSVYPAINQSVFALSVLGIKQSLLSAVVIMKLCVLFSEIGSIVLIIKLLDTFLMKRMRVMLYALNPLVILEFSHSMHFEVFMVFFVLLAIYLLQQNRWVLSSLAMGLAISTKIIPLIYLPILWRRLPFWKFVIYGMLSITLFTALLIPFFNEYFIDHFTQSLTLYFKTFEFNSSLARINDLFYGQLWFLKNWFLPALEISVLLLAYLYFGKKNMQQILLGLCVISTTYFLFTRSLHPWYISPVCALAVFTNLRYPFVWSYLIAWTYISYITPVYQQNIIIICVEYLVLIPLIIVDLHQVWITNPKKDRFFIRNRCI